jgi:tripartite-type tricarboxylate transporter receptor subunit TctC
LAPRLGQPISVENRPGAGGNIAAEATVRSSPDGYTLLVAPIGIMAVNRHLFPNLPFDPARDLSPVSHLWNTALILLVPDTSPYRSVADLVAAGRVASAPLSCGTSGNGSSDHLVMAAFANRTGLNLAHVPYRAGGPAVMADLMGGRLDMAIGNISAYLGGVRSGRLRALATTGAERWPTLPEVPTMAEAGVTDLVVSSWSGLVGPRGLPDVVRGRLAAEVAAVSSDSAYRARMIEIGGVPVGSGPAELERLSARESARWGEIVRRLGIRAD